MKTTLFLLLVALGFLVPRLSSAQPICGFDVVHQRAMKTNALYRRHVQEGESAIRSYILQHPGLSRTRIPRALISDKAGAAPVTLGTVLYTIPVVVHVVHTGGAVGTIYNPTDAQIKGAIDYLNAVYNGSYPGTTGVGDLQIQFALAQRDPDCNSTTGINRVDGSGIPGYVSGGINANTTVGTDELNVKDLIRWDPSQYYNVWVVDKIDGHDGTSGQFIAGFAYFPGSLPSMDGIVMLATQMIAGQKTLPHEIGHAFNLYHPFQGSTSSTDCQANGNCNTDGDQVCDTDPISYNATVSGVVDFTCRSGANSCNGNAPYNDSTEANYMNYTNCFHVFTPGQKARMLAAAAGIYRSTLATSLGTYAPSAGPSPCVPKINFELSGDQVTETTAANSGCRAYKDYTYNMVIGNTPTATATATLGIASGTATPGVDFDITTNGSFTSPSQVLSFPAGSLASQPFTIRVYDDAGVNGARNLVLNFTISNGGGNAVAGDGQPEFTLTIADNDAAPTGGSPNGSGIVGTSSISSNIAPFKATLVSQRTQFLYKASELTAAGIPAGPLTGLAFRLATKNSTRPFTNFKINIGTASVNYLLDNGALTLGSNLTTVKSLAAYSTQISWNTFMFDLPYNWDGVSNLVVEVCYDNGSAAPSDGDDNVVYFNDGGTADQSNTLRQNDINCAQPFSSVDVYSNGVKPYLKFFYGIPATLVEATLNSSITQYLGPNADLYFYDQSNGQLMARIQNLSTFDYGCTQVLVDRSGMGASPFWTNNTPDYLMSKTFKVIPTTNNPSGNYNITLYYTQDEVGGWQTATGNSLGNIRIVKASGQISAVTPASPDGGGTVVTGTPAIGNLGTNISLTYNFTNGFSGFGAGIPGLDPLPVTLLDFEGKLQNDHARLDWSTSMESGSKSFGIERSYDGAGFKIIGFVNATGKGPSQYHFIDPSPAEATNYYRLRQIDQDDRFTYSKILLLQADAGTRLFTITPSPFDNSLDIHFTHTPTSTVGIRLLDMTGKALFRTENRRPAAGPVHIDLSSTALSAGIYLLEIRYNNQVYTEKVVKK